MKGQINMSKNQFDELHKMVEKMDGMLETLEIKSNRDLMASIRRSEQDVKKGRVKKLGSVEEIKKW